MIVAIYVVITVRGIYQLAAFADKDYAVSVAGQLTKRPFLFDKRPNTLAISRAIANPPSLSVCIAELPGHAIKIFFHGLTIAWSFVAVSPIAWTSAALFPSAESVTVGFSNAKASLGF